MIYGANLSFDMLQIYVKLALQARLLHEEPKSRALVVIARGRLFLKEFDVLTRLIGEEAIQQEV